MSLQESSRKILDQLIAFVQNFNESQYKTPVGLLSQNSIGCHVRHVIEFYECLIIGYKTGLVNYDQRNRKKELECNPILALEALNYITLQIDKVKVDKALRISINLSSEGGPVNLETSFYRELAYNIEHAIHHMAILRIAIEFSFPDHELDHDFGIAYSTLRYKTQTCVQ